MPPKIIAHLDMDSFFASVEEAITPRFLGRPIVVGSEVDKLGRGRGVVSTANYKAREYGIHSAMPIMTAWKLSQEAKKQGKEEVVFLPVDFELYHKVSRAVAEIISYYATEVEQASVDEFYFDLSFTGSYQEAEEICKQIKVQIKATQKVTCSIGIGPNKLIAKIAAGCKKPDGLFTVEESQVQDFLNPLSIRELPGIGPKTAQVFYKRNIKLIKDLLPFSKEELKKLLGKHGESIYEKVRGVDDSQIENNREVKSIGEQTTFSQNSLEAEFIFAELKKVSDHVWLRFKSSGFTHFKTLALVIRFSDFENKTSSKSFKEGIGLSQTKKFELEIMRLVLPFLDQRANPKAKPLRLIGVRVERLESSLL